MPHQFLPVDLQSRNIYSELKNNFHKKHSNMVWEEFLTTISMAPVKQCILLQIEKVAKSIKYYLVWHMFSIEDTVTHLVTSSPGGILTKSKPDNKKLLKEVYSSISTKKKKKPSKIFEAGTDFSYQTHAYQKGMYINIIASKSYKVLYQAVRQSFICWSISCRLHNLLLIPLHQEVSERSWRLEICLVALRLLPLVIKSMLIFKACCAVLVVL